MWARQWIRSSESLVLPCLLVGVLSQSGCGRIGYDELNANDGGQPRDAMGLDAAQAALSFRRACDLSTHVIIENGISVDDSAGNQLSQAVGLGCNASITTRVVSQDDASEVDMNTGRPLVPANELIILGGGDGPHRVVRYLLDMDTPLKWGGSPIVITERATDRIIAQGTTDSANDFLLIQVIEEPIGGTISLSAQGLQANGTTAAVLYFENTSNQWLGDSTLRWLVIQWRDSDGTAGPSDDDTFDLIESG